MNKKFAIVLALSLIAIVCCAGCIDPQDPVDPVDPVVPVDPVDPVTPPVEPVVPAEEYSVFFMLNYDGAGSYSAETVTAGDAVSKPATPTRSGYTFKGWFTAAEGGAEYDFTQAVNADLTLYAQWKKISSSSGGSSHTHVYKTGGYNGAQYGLFCSCGAFKPSESINAAIDEAPSGSTINLGTTFTESKEITVGAKDVVIDISDVDVASGKTVHLVYDEETPIKIKATNVPDTGVEVVIKDETAGTEKKVKFEEEPANGLLVPAAAVDETNQVADAYTASGLEHIASLVNPTLAAHVEDAQTEHVQDGWTVLFYESAPTALGNEVTGNSGWTITLMDDIDLQNKPWTPIGTANNPFCGIFDGNGKTISNLTITGTDCLGFFGNLYGTVKDLSIDKVQITGNHYLGGIAGYGKSGLITNCNVTNAVITATPKKTGEVYDDGDKVGGIVGYGYCDAENHDGLLTVSNCYVADSRITGFRDVGGIAGAAQGDAVTGNTVSDVNIVVDKATNKYTTYNINGAAVLGRNLDSSTLSGNIHSNVNIEILVDSIDALKKAVDVDEGVIKLVADITGDVTVVQKLNVKLTIDGNNHKFNGVITVDGKSSRYETAFLTIQNVNFEADTLSADAFIRLGHVDAARYTHGVTVKNCTFSGNGFVAVKSYTGGDWNLTIDGCIVYAGMHSLAQLANVEKGLKITGCKVHSKNGINLNSCPSLEMSDCTFDVKGYAVRFGPESGTKVAKETFSITDCTLKTDNSEGDAVIIFRSTAQDATLTLIRTTLEGATQISGATADTVIIIDGVGILDGGITYTEGEDGSKTYTTSESTSLDNLNSITQNAVGSDTIVLGTNVAGTATDIAPYGNNVGIVIKNGATFDGQGNTLTVTDGSNTYAVMTYGGTIQNLKIDSGVRGIVSYTPTTDVVLNTVYIDGPGYAFNSAEHRAVKLIVSGSTLNGWTSFAGFTDASFTLCNFGENTKKYWQNVGYSQDYDRLIRPYVTTMFDKCAFENGFYIDLSALADGCKVTLKDCTVDSTEITEENYSTLITIELPSEKTLVDCVIFE